MNRCLRVRFFLCALATITFATTAAAQLTQSAIFWVDGVSKLGRVNLDGSGFQVLLSNLTNPVSVDVDENSQQVYWVEGSGQTSVRRADYNGANVTTILNAPPLQTFYGISVDPPTGVMMIAEKTLNFSQQHPAHIVTAFLNGTGVSSLSPLNPSINIRTVAYSSAFQHVYFSPGSFVGIEGKPVPGNTVEPNFPAGGAKGLAFGFVNGVPTVFFDNGTAVGSFDPTITFPTPQVTNVPVPATAAPIYGVDFNDSIFGRLVWGTVGATQSQLFSAMPDGSQYQVVYTGSEQFVDVAMAPYVPPVPEPSAFALVVAAACMTGTRRRHRLARRRSLPK